SGNCLKVKWVCDALAQPYEWIAIDTMKGESRTPEFLALNGAGQVPVVVLDDGRALAQSNAIIRYLARDSAFIPADAYQQAKMDEWLFWEQYSHEPYIATCRFQMVYLGRPVSDLDPDKVKRGYFALARMEQQLAHQRYFVGDRVTLADIALLAYTRVAHQGGFHLDGYAAIRRWIADAEQAVGVV
ncbi:MAG: glutathione S-transferase family protein, partial [Tardiphaga sp.]|uniref:glutathione S-transferase family protein n=1 Tax=Tardiphaga sp. TaxID=1926292 RepID=UPI00199FC41E